MVALEKQLDIQSLHKQGFSCSEIARRLQIDRRTVRGRIEDPERINRPRKAVIRPSKVDPFREAIAAYCHHAAKNQLALLKDGNR